MLSKKGDHLCEEIAVPLSLSNYRYNSQKCPGPDSNRHGRYSRGILSPLRLPIPPPGHYAERSSELWRRRPESNRGMTVLQTVALPLGYAAPVTWNLNFTEKNFFVNLAKRQIQVSLQIRVDFEASVNNRLPRQKDSFPEKSCIDKTTSF